MDDTEYGVFTVKDGPVVFTMEKNGLVDAVAPVAVEAEAAVTRLVQTGVSANMDAHCSNNVHNIEE